MTPKTKWFPQPYTIVFILLIVSAVSTYILPSGHYDYKIETTNEIIKAKDVSSYQGNEKLVPIPNTYTYVDKNPQGIKAIFSAPILGTIDAIEIIIFILIIGVYLTMIVESGAFDTAINQIIKKLNGKEHVLILSIIVLFSFLGTIEGWQEETTPFYPLLIPILVRAGYDPLLAISVIFISAIMGIAASVINPFSVGIAAQFAGISIIDGMVFRLIIYIVYVSSFTLFIMKYGRKIKKDITKSSVFKEVQAIQLEASQSAPESMEYTLRHKIIVLMFTLSFTVMVYGLIPFDRFGYPKLALGWWFSDLSAIFLFTTILTGIIAGFKEPKIIKIIKKGLSEFAPVVAIIGLSRGITIILKQGIIEDTILNFLSQSLVGFSPTLFIVSVYLIFVILSFIITSTSAMATLTMPIISPLAVMLDVPVSAVISAFSFGMATVFMINPADPILNVALTNAKINYLQWFRFIRPFVFVFIMIAVAALIIKTSIFL